MVGNIFGGQDQNDGDYLDDYLLGNQNDMSMGDGSVGNQGNMRAKEPANLDYFTSTGQQKPNMEHRAQKIKLNVSDLSSQQPRVKREPPTLKGQSIMGLVNKLSNMGFSMHERFLKLNKKGLSYFSEKPPNFDENE